jgi:hypothetical protein
MNAFLHWLNVELWSPMWPNMFAPSLVTLPVVIISHLKAARQRERHHGEMKQHVTDTMGER